MNQTHYFVTGGTGMIGSAFICSLPDVVKVTVLTRNKKRAQARLAKAKCALKYVSDFSQLTSLDGYDFVINLAGEPIADKRWTVAQKQRIENSRWRTTEQLVTLMQAGEKPPKVFISGSAIGYYGRQSATPVTESDHKVHDEFTHKLCLKWEHAAKAAESERTRVCLLRTGIVLGKGQGALGKMTLPFKLGLGGPIGDGDQGMSWIHIDDMIAGIHYLLQHPDTAGPFNFTAPHPVSNRDFVSALGNALHRPAFMPMPAFSLRLLMGEAADLLLTGQYVLPERLQQAGFEFTYPSLDTALAEIFAG